MNTKLTLKLDKFVIEKAKEYAALHKRSLSKLIETYLKHLTEKKPGENKNNFEISPFVKSMKTGVSVPPDLDHKKAYRKHLSEKYK